jgi:hypothetical protein
MVVLPKWLVIKRWPMRAPEPGRVQIVAAPASEYIHP